MWRVFGFECALFSVASLCDLWYLCGVRLGLRVALFSVARFECALFSVTRFECALFGVFGCECALFIAASK